MNQFEPFDGFFNLVGSNELSKGLITICGGAGSGKSTIMRSVLQNSIFSKNKVLYVSEYNNRYSLKEHYYILNSYGCDIYDIIKYLRQYKIDILIITDSNVFNNERDRSKVYERIILLEKTNRTVKKLINNSLSIINRNKKMEELIELFNVENKGCIFLETVSNGIPNNHSIASARIQYMSNIILNIRKQEQNFYIDILKNRYGNCHNNILLNFNFRESKISVM